MHVRRKTDEQMHFSSMLPLILLAFVIEMVQPTAVTNRDEPQPPRTAWLCDTGSHMARVLSTGVIQMERRLGVGQTSEIHAPECSAPLHSLECHILLFSPPACRMPLPGPSLEVAHTSHVRRAVPRA